MTSSILSCKMFDNLTEATHVALKVKDLLSKNPNHVWNCYKGDVKVVKYKLEKV